MIEIILMMSFSASVISLRSSFTILVRSFTLSSKGITSLQVYNIIVCTLYQWLFYNYFKLFNQCFLDFTADSTMVYVHLRCYLILVHSVYVIHQEYPSCDAVWNLLNDSFISLQLSCSHLLHLFPTNSSSSPRCLSLYCISFISSLVLMFRRIICTVAHLRSVLICYTQKAHYLPWKEA